MKKTIVVTSLFAVCILMALPLTSATESSDVVDNQFNHKGMIVNRLSSLSDSIERIGVCNIFNSINQSDGLLDYLSCLIGFIILAVVFFLSLFGVL